MGPLILTADREPSNRLFDVLTETDPKFRRTWRHSRGREIDASMSAHDMALACIAVRAGWGDQQVADLIIAHRYKYPENGDPAKALRMDYMLATIRKARSGFADQDVIREAAGAERAEIAAERHTAMSAATHDELLASLCARLQMPVQRCIKQGEDNPTYSLEVLDGDDRSSLVKLGSGDDLLNQRRCKAQLMNLTTRLLPPMRQAEWDNAIEVMMKLWECDDLEGEDNDIATLWDWVGEYLGVDDGLAADTRVEMVPRSAPFRWEGRVWVTASRFNRWIRYLGSCPFQRSGKGELTRLLKQAGFTYSKVAVRIGTLVVGRGYWSAPER